MIDKNRYNYDFSGLETAMSHLRQNQNESVLNEIRNELNRFFKDSKCIDVIFTRNIDKFFFGMRTLAVINSDDDVEEITMDDKPFRIQKYYLEIDSKLIDNMNLSKEELTAVILHEVGHLVNDSSPTEQVRHAIDDYMASTGDSLSIKDSIHFKEVLAYAIKDTYWRVTSLFTRKDDEILADEFVYMCGYGEALESAFRKITTSASTINKGVDNQFIVLDWTLHLYKNMKFERIRAISALNGAKKYTASKLEKKELETAVRSLNKIDDIALQEASVIYEELVKKNSLIQRMQHDGLKSIEEDVYEYMMRIRNVEEEDDALLIMRQINMRMSLLDDYLQNSDIEDKDRARWQKVYDKYDELRDVLSKKTVYNRKKLGLWMDYNYAGDSDR
jgi:hypothetical protein